MKFRATILVLMAFVLISCNKEVEIDDVEMVGKWTMVAYDYSGSNTISSTSYSLKTDFVGVLKESDFILEFKSNPNTYETSKSYIIELSSEVSDLIIDGEVAFEGYTDVQEAEIVDYESDGTWSITGDMLSGLNFISSEANPTGSQSSDYQITKLTNTKMELDFSVSQTTQQQGATALVEAEGTIVFEK